MHTVGQPAGSSPRLRGTAAPSAPIEGPARFIPAPAGNGSDRNRFCNQVTVHPRACGERGAIVDQPDNLFGSSPRLRGTAPRMTDTLTIERFIPAPAGNGTMVSMWCIGRTVHPRACGERPGRSAIGHAGDGSSPRLRGTAAVHQPGQHERRFIPAPAGNGARMVSFIGSAPVHPRACGERDDARTATAGSSGSSPRLRGTAGREDSHLPEVRFIPAPAGNGTRPVNIVGISAGSSPRLRGTALGHSLQLPRIRFIPAPAGNGNMKTAQQTKRAVHPRACGERASLDSIVLSKVGSSPRLRGTEGVDARRCLHDRFIPAPAGNGPTSRDVCDVTAGSSPRLRGTEDDR